MAVHAFDRVDARAGEVCVVLGFGAIGACSALVGRALGLDVLVSEPSAERLTHAARARAAGPRAGGRAA